jgi:hypothetical protein
VNIALMPDLIPAPLWGISAARLLATPRWRAIRADVITDAGGLCYACGGVADETRPVGFRMVADEVWAYVRNVATLADIRLACPPCDGARHFGLQSKLGFSRAGIARLMEVNRISEAGAIELRASAFQRWRELSEIERWRVQVNPDLLERWPDLSVLCGALAVT